MNKTKNLVMIALISAISFALVATIRIPVVMFLKYEPKDVAIVISGLIFGPLNTIYTALIVSFIEMITISDTGIIGFVMNFLGTVSFATTTAIVYKKIHTKKGAVLGLVLGTIFMTTIMMLWNYFLTPIFLGWPREEVVKILVPAILPFNLLKGGINMVLTLVFYKPIVMALRRYQIINDHEVNENKLSYLVYGIILIISITLFCLILKNII